MNSERQALVLGVVPARFALVAALPRELAEAEALLSGLCEQVCARSEGQRLDGTGLVGQVFAFPDAAAALAFCAAVQKEALDLEWPELLLRRPECQAESGEHGGPAFRGIRLAMAVDLQVPDEIGLHALARLAALAAPGRILLSDAAAARVGDAAQTTGTHAQPGLRGVREVFECCPDGLDRAFGEPRPAPWPAPVAPLIGREGDLAALEELSSLGMRVVCVSGEPGVGKSQLLRRFSRDKAHRGAKVVAIDLDDARDDWDAISAIARAVRVPLRERRGKEQAIQRIASAVMALSGALLVVDHCHEEAAADALRAVVRRSPGSRWIIGGPGRLGVAAEVGYVVGPLVERDAGARLFHDTAQRARGDYRVDTGSEALAIAAELEHNPLAIAIAGSCVSEVRPLALFDRLASGRGHTMRILDLALSLRPPAELEMLSRLAVFAGGFTEAGAIAVSGGTLENLYRLVHTGLLQTSTPTAAPGTVFYALHPRIRRAVLERHPPDADRVLRLAEYLAARCDDWTDQLWTERADAVMARMALERKSLRDVIENLQERPRLSAPELTVLAALLEGAVRLAIEEGAVGPLLPALERALQAVGMCLDADPLVAVRLFRVRGMAREHLRQIDGALADLKRAESLAERWAEPVEVARARFHAGRLQYAAGQYDRAREELLGAWAGFEESGRRVEAAETRAELGRTLMMLGDVEGAVEELQAASRNLDSAPTWLRGLVANTRALALQQASDLQGAQAGFEEALAMWVRIGRWDAASLVRVQLALLLQTAGQLEAATTHFALAEDIARRWGDSPRRGVVLTQLGLAQLELGDRTSAHRTFIQAVSACRAGGDRAGLGAARGFLGLLHHLSGRLQEARQGYRGALRDLESGGDRRFGALFHSCLGAVEAELGNLDEARILVDLAQLQLPDADPSLRDAMLVFHRAIDLARAEVAESRGDLAAAKDLRKGVDDALAQLDDRVDNVYLRFARTHLAALAGGSR